ncbi:MAG: hypothetical protein EBV05_03965 [Cyanobacteria bacterium WB6_1B_304]|nr:hypothetical protein [Cyanobacteria bacterium WB6_1B_304]
MLYNFFRNTSDEYKRRIFSLWFEEKTQINFESWLLRKFLHYQQKKWLNENWELKQPPWHCRQRRRFWALIFGGTLLVSFLLINLNPRPKSPSPPTAINRTALSSATAGIAGIPQDWWDQGADSPLAIAIGMAEGTRQLDGTKNPAYYWHTDPGNRANNFGTFSYQHLSPNEIQAVKTAREASEKQKISAQLDLPTVADQRQLKKLRRFEKELLNMAQAKGITLNQEELINGLDLANQSEAAAFSHWGFIDRLAQMRQLVTDPAEQLTEARVWSYWCPKRNQWDAPGLNNNYEDIRRDQERRQKAIHRFFSRQTWHDWIADVPLSEQIETQARRIINW